MKTIQKIISKLFKILLPFIDQMAYLRYFNQPLTSLPKSSFQNYKNPKPMSFFNLMYLIPKRAKYSASFLRNNQDWIK